LSAARPRSEAVRSRPRPIWTDTMSLILLLLATGLGAYLLAAVWWPEKF
jgi:K+-transporting ATPase KdpF subunit